MPDLANRADHEASLTRALQPVFASIAAQGDRVDWVRAEREAEELTFAVLQPLYNESYRGLYKQFTPEGAAFPGISRTSAVDAARTQAREIASSIIAARRTAWEAARATAAEVPTPEGEERLSAEMLTLYLLYGLPRKRADGDVGGFNPLRAGTIGRMSPDLQSRLVALERYEISDAWRTHLEDYLPRSLRDKGFTRFDPSRGIIDLTVGPDAADDIAVTETTRANSRAERAAAEDFERATGVKIVAYWHTEEDGRVCSRCEAVNRQPERIWLARYPDGPPVHPRCRCWLDWDEER